MVAAIAAAGIRLRIRKGGRRLRADRNGETLERAQAREADPEERPSPLGEGTLDELVVAVREARGDLRGRVARLRERVDELFVDRLGPTGRIDPEREFRRRMQGVLEWRQFVECILADEVWPRLRESFEVQEGVCQAFPEIGDRRCVVPSLGAPERPFHEPAIIPSLAG